MKNTPHPDYRPALIAMKAGALGATLLRKHPGAVAPPVTALAQIVSNHERALQKATRERARQPADARSLRARLLRQLDAAVAGILPTQTTRRAAR